MIAIILAGGLGTRLREVVPELPKVLAPVMGRPFIEYLFDYLIAQKIQRVVLSVGYKKSAIVDQYGQQYKDLAISYAAEDEPLGTGGALINALRFVDGNENVFLLNGDTFFPVDLPALLDFHQASDSDISLALCYMKNARRYGVVELSGNQIEGFAEKQQVDAGWINGGVYCVSTRALLDSPLKQAPISLEEDILAKAGSLNLKLGGFQSEAPFLDIGVPESYEKAPEFLHHCASLFTQRSS